MDRKGGLGTKSVGRKGRYHHDVGSILHHTLLFWLESPEKQLSTIGFANDLIYELGSDSTDKQCKTNLDREMTILQINSLV